MSPATKWFIRRLASLIKGIGSALDEWMSKEEEAEITAKGKNNG